MSHPPFSPGRFPASPPPPLPATVRCPPGSSGRRRRAGRAALPALRDWEGAAEEPPPAPGPRPPCPGRRDGARAAAPRTAGLGQCGCPRRAAPVGAMRPLLRHLLLAAILQLAPAQVSSLHRPRSLSLMALATRRKVLMIRYPSSQLGEMSLEEHSQCECRPKKRESAMKSDRAATPHHRPQPRSVPGWDPVPGAPSPADITHPTSAPGPSAHAAASAASTLIPGPATADADAIASSVAKGGA
ncbi:vascular endothelial growth factor B isoform X9 [Heterocephalus glaber]|uniref:Vascular endothelial growth factor B isoform X9 n=1 Tax=Heterocephalus glaber TaxID=10181 RepID=A0AAX6TF36_HETGA|nr:vascular endothelial growth factor B isoform X9 [Heterocephalus glaber]